MAKRKTTSDSFGSNRAYRELSDMKHKDLQRACVARGMEFQKVVESDIPGLASWFCKNYENSQNHLLLNEFDDWKTLELKARGYEDGDPYFHPNLRLGFIGTRDEHGEITSTKKPRLKGMKKNEKKKRERVEGTKVLKGTKKALTYELANQRIAIDKVVKQVMETFPEASEKSIRIWYKRAQKKPGPKE